MITHYTAIVFLSVIAMLGFIIGIQSNSFMRQERKKWFQCLLLSLMVVNLAEWGAAVLDGDTARVVLRIALKYTELACAPFVAVFFMLTTCNRKYTKASIFIGICNAILQTVSLFNHVVFYVDENSVYHRQSFYLLYLLLLVVNIVLMGLEMYDFGRRFQFHNVPLCLTISLMALLSFVVQIFWSYLRLDWVCISFAALLFYIYVDQLQQQVDTLTGLLNRRTYENRIAKGVKRTQIIFLDVNRFKEVNDTYGHAVGDECLKAVADEIKKVFQKSGYCFRYGGDEFCVMMPEKNGDVEAYLEKLAENVKTVRYHGTLPLPTLSYGYDLLTEGKTYSEVIQKADEMMYQNKAKNRKNTANR